MPKVKHQQPQIHSYFHSLLWIETMKTELVFIPLPATGHLISMVELAKLLTARDEQLSITILLLKLPLDSKAFTYVESMAAGASGIRFIDLPVAEPEVSPNQGSPFRLLSTLIENHKLQVRDVVAEIIQSGSTRIAGFMLDMFCTAMVDVANELGVPTYLFYTSSAAALGLRFHVLSLVDDCNQDITQYKDSESELSIPVHINPVPVKLWPSSFFDKAGMIFHHTRRYKEAKGILVNTFQELELHAIEALSRDKNIPPVYPVGPLINFEGLADSNQEVDIIMKWLDDQPASSVVFLCFGSMGSFEGEQVKEIAEALERTGHRFLWSLRRPSPKGHLEYPGEYKDFEDILPEGFLQRTVGVGKVIGWAPQVQVLSHPAVGGFVSHCGWNSTLEGVSCGVPIAVWPMYAEQQMNAFELVKELGIAVEIKMDYRKDFMVNNPIIVKADEIEDGIRKLMELESEIRKKVKELKEKSRISLMEGGSSYHSVESLIEEFHLVH